MARILFIDDDDGGRQMAAYNLRKAGHAVDEADNGQAGLDAFRPDLHDLVITDVRMPELSGIEVTRRIHESSADVPVLVITAYGSLEKAVEAMQAGARDFVLKPFSRDHLLLAVDRALQHRALTRENRELRRRLSGIEREIIHVSGAMADVVAMADKVAQSDATVLVTGESGVGKELIARRIHARSARTDRSFVAVNCGAMPADLIEAELFGHEKGAFTGAQRSRIGRFRQADGGTLFLDEIGELTGAAQTKLLRVLQEGMVDVVGGDEPVAVDTRIVAATNKDLRAEIAAGRFREDLFYRLHVVEVKVPPLRDRREDIPALVRHFVTEVGAGRTFHIPQDVIDEMRRRPWTGNVRELRNACERMVILCPDDHLSRDQLPPNPEESANDATDVDATRTDGLTFPPEGFSLLDLEKRVIEQVLRNEGGNMSEAARYLRIPRHVLVYRIEKYGIARPSKK